MSKGTPSRGKRQTQTHLTCRRCGKMSYHKRHKICSSCGFGKTPKLRGYRWINKRPKVATH